MYKKIPKYHKVIQKQCGKDWIDLSTHECDPDFSPKNMYAFMYDEETYKSISDCSIRVIDRTVIE